MRTDVGTCPFQCAVRVERGQRIVLDRTKVEENGRRILDKYRISADRSKDLERF